jgi:transposase
LPVSIEIGPGNEHESRRLIPILKNIRIRSRGTHRPRSKPKRVHADSKYHTPLVMMYLASRSIAARIKERANMKTRPGRPRIFDNGTYTRIRSSIERFFGWLKSFRRIQTRYDRLTSTYLGFVQLGCAMIMMRRVFR